MNLKQRIKSLLLVSPPAWMRSIGNRATWKIHTDEPVIYLTFDDGPSPEVTPWILGQLERYQARATFFCVGAKVVENPGLYKRIIVSGHTAGNHTFSHLDGWRTLPRHYLRDVDRAGAVINSRLFRPPYGRMGIMACRLLARRFRIIFWDVLSMDYDGSLSPEAVLGNVMSKAGPGSIIVFHDHIRAFKNLTFVLPKALDHFSGLGYRFGALNDNQENNP